MRKEGDEDATEEMQKQLERHRQALTERCKKKKKE